jgi:hypothetical protein
MIIIENKSINIYNIQTITVLQPQINVDVNVAIRVLEFTMVIRLIMMLVKIIN